MAFHIKIGNYRFSKNLGTGSFGKVKMAQNEVTGHKVAIKILNKKKIKQQGVFEKVKREIKVLRMFNHPHIIKHYEFIDTPSDIFMVIEFASGGELFDLISRRERLTEEEARRFFQQIYSSIEYTHFHKIAHRDLKPENLLLDEYNNIKLIDFGLANSMKDSQALKTACGSPNYAAPEVISGRSYGGVEVDIWSLGVILFAMVCGSLPFDDDSMSSLFNKIKEGRYYMPNYISYEVRDLINRMLQPNPVKRITMKEIKDHPWYLKNLPKYLQDLSNYHAKSIHNVDLDIVDKIMKLNINLQGRSQEEVIKAIKEKKNTDFCGIYELYYHDKMKKETLNIQQKCFDESGSSIGDPLGLDNHLSYMVSSPRSTTSSSVGNKCKKFKTLKHVLMHQQEPDPSLSSQGGSISHNLGSKTQQQHSPLNVSKGAIQKDNSATLEGNSPYTLLSQKHNDRLSRIIKKFRSGDIPSHQNFSSFKQKQSSSQLSAFGRLGGTSQVSTQVETIANVTQQKTAMMMTSSQPPIDSQTNQRPLIQMQPPGLIRNPPHQKWVFGLIFKGTPIDLMTLTCEVLKLVDIEWQIIPKDLKLKCRSRIDENSVIEYEQSLQGEGGDDASSLQNSNKDEMIKQYLRLNFVKFYINIYKDNAPPVGGGKQPAARGGGPSSGSGPGTNTATGMNTPHNTDATGKSISGMSSANLDDIQNAGTKYMLDIHLFKGTMYVFMDFVRKFMHVLTSSCSLCISNSACNSSAHSSNVDAMSNQGGGHSHTHHDYKLKLQF